MTNKFKISKIIELHKNVILVIYTDLSTQTNDVVLVKNKPESKNLNELCYKANDVILSVTKRRKNEKRTEIMTLEFDSDFYDAVTVWCESLKITFEQLAFAFVEFVGMFKNRCVVIPWMKELQNEQH
ncbi:MAG: hypothetical protein IKI97_07460 [Clostridia bacterium]|nr:hypothetical protein [Clostridia bacterium]